MAAVCGRQATRRVLLTDKQSGDERATDRRSLTPSPPSVARGNVRCHMLQSLAPALLVTWPPRNGTGCAIACLTYNLHLRRRIWTDDLSSANCYIRQRVWRTSSVHRLQTIRLLSLVLCADELADWDLARRLIFASSPNRFQYVAVVYLAFVLRRNSVVLLTERSGTLSRHEKNICRSLEALPPVNQVIAKTGHDVAHTAAVLAVSSFAAGRHRLDWHSVGYVRVSRWLKLLK